MYYRPVMAGQAMLFTFILLAVMTELVKTQLSPCIESDLEYVYTACDSNKERWRVSVPKHSSQCRVDSPKPPVKGPDCDKSCTAGEYLDVAGDQQCKKCRAGSYSVGNGIRFDQWDTLPDTFTVTPGTSVLARRVNCTNESTKWVPSGEYLEGVPGDCDADLTFSAELVTDGTLTIEYQNTYTMMMSIVKVKSLCQSTPVGKPSDYDGFKLLKKTSDKEFERESLRMAPGSNKITLSLVGLKSSSPGTRFAIKSIEIRGTAFTSTCTSCKAGYYTGEGAGYCTPCPENTYAPSMGTESCLSCGVTEFSSLGATECKPRPACTNSDYYATIAPCSNGTTHVTYEWLEPKYCNDAHSASVSLPEAGAEMDCPACNPGQAMSDEQGVCEYCEEGEYSDGSLPCTQCPLHTEARKSLSFRHFHTMPDRFSTGCIKTGGEGTFCDKQSTWMPSKDGGYMKVSDDIPDEAFAVLNINVSGFANSSIDGRVYGRLTLKFQMSCEKSDPCILYLMQEDFQEKSIMSWNASHSHGVFTHNFTHNNIKTLSLAFRKSIETRNYPSRNSVSVSEITLTNTLHGAAVECTECMLGGSEKGCHSCEVGEVIDTDNTTQVKSCVKCPDNHIVVDSFTCAECGPGLVSNADSTECVSDCSYADDDMKFDFKPLGGIQTYNGLNMFTADGTTYHHTFNYLLCNTKTKAKASFPSCANNASESYYWDDSMSVTSLICRETVLPADTTVSIQPTSLGDKLVGISTNNKTERGKLTKQGGVVLSDNELTIHYRYETSHSTEHCEHGLSTTITLICDDKEKGNGTVSFPPKCVTGTCEGCEYQLVWRTEHACPRCEESDYEQIVGECKLGQQSVRYLPQKYCPMTDAIRAKLSTRECSMLTLPIKIGILVSASVGVLLLFCVIYCWKRSKKLEYKYMRLVEGAQGKEGELPAAQTCAWSEDDEEEEKSDLVAFKRKGDQLFGKLGNNSKGDGFEKMKLVGSSLPEI